MTASLARTDDEIQHMPLVELAFELLKSKKEPMYFREIMNQIQELRGMTEDEAMEVIARLYTEINIDGRFICIGQNVWGLKRWYPVDKANERPTSRRFVRGSGDAFSDDDEELDEYEVAEEDESDFVEDTDLVDDVDGEDEDDADSDDYDAADEDEDDAFADADDADAADEDLAFVEDEEEPMAEADEEFGGDDDERL
ncbi:MAG: DNA-directed RNA polymerase subunit delta [Alicyclobacillus sp.]|nr:DNA-directed RNA polymerase subunit delta [Alicyclobacillus sp.]